MNEQVNDMIKKVKDSYKLVVSEHPDMGWGGGGRGGGGGQARYKLSCIRAPLHSKGVTQYIMLVPTVPPGCNGST